MAQVIVRQCDHHLDQAEEVPGFSVPGLTTNGKPVRIDLCPPCIEAFAKPFQALLDKYGQPIEDGAAAVRTKPKSSGERHPCPTCPKRKTYESRNRLLTHMEKIHGTTLNDADEIIPVTEETHPYGCPDQLDDGSQCHRRFKSSSARGTHRSSEHGYRAGDDEGDGLFAGAEPTGVTDGEGVLVGAAD